MFGCHHTWTYWCRSYFPHSPFLWKATVQCTTASSLFYVSLGLWYWKPNAQKWYCLPAPCPEYPSVLSYCSLSYYHVDHGNFLQICKYFTSPYCGRQPLDADIKPKMIIHFNVKNTPCSIITQGCTSSLFCGNIRTIDAALDSTGTHLFRHSVFRGLFTLWNGIHLSDSIGRVCFVIVSECWWLGFRGCP